MKMNKRILDRELTSFNVGEMRVALVQGDITEEETDAIVNAANQDLNHAGGLARAIATKGGESIQETSNEYIREFGRVPTGGCVVLPSGDLKSRYLIHAVGPIYSEYTPNEAKKLLKDVVKNCFGKTKELDLASISLPAVSSGIYGYPNRCCAYDLLEEIVEGANYSDLEYVRVTIFDDETIGDFLPVFDEFRENLVFE